MWVLVRVLGRKVISFGAYLSDKPTAIQSGAMAGAAGIVSSLCSGPAELLMIQQQRSGLSFLSQAAAVANKHGWLSIFRGLVWNEITSTVS